MFSVLCSSSVGELEHSATFTSPGKIVRVDIGNQKLGNKLGLQLKVKNATGGSLDMDLSASCGCTELSAKKVSVEIDGEFRVSLALKIPNSEEDIGLHILFVDSTSKETYKIEVRGKAMPLFGCKQKELLFQTKTLLSSRVDLIENYQEERIETVKLVNSNAYGIMSTEGNSLTFRSIKGARDFFAEPIVLVLTSKLGKEVVVTMPVEFVGVARLSPSLIALRKEANSYRAVLLVSGVEIPEGESHIKVRIENQGVELDGRIEKFQARSERSHLLIVLFSLEQIDNVVLAAESEIRVVSEAGGWTCKSKLLSFRY